MDEGKELPAGRELDALVAEKVMGWHYFQRPYANAEGMGWETHSPAGAQALFSDEKLAPRYSTDIAAAWEVVEKLRADEWWFWLCQDNTDIWDAKFWHGQTKGWFPSIEAFGNAYTPEGSAAAICRAALKTVGV